MAQGAGGVTRGHRGTGLEGKACQALVWDPRWGQMGLGSVVSSLWDLGRPCRPAVSRLTLNPGFPCRLGSTPLSSWTMPAAPPSQCAVAPTSVLSSLACEQPRQALPLAQQTGAGVQSILAVLEQPRPHTGGSSLELPKWPPAAQMATASSPGG